MNVYHAISKSRVKLPRLTLAQRVVDKIVRNAERYDTETGESLIGLEVQGVNQDEADLLVLDTISPDQSAIRLGAYFEQGDDLQGDIFNWWSDNWDEQRQQEHMPVEWNVPLSHLGDWHKHPGHLVTPSWGDTDTARDHIRDESNGASHLLAILATVWRSSEAGDPKATPAEDEPKPIKIPINDDYTVRIDCWYISRKTRRFVRIAARVIADNMLPLLPTLGWHLAQPERLGTEIQALQRDGYAVSLDEDDTDGKAPFEICLTLANRSGSNILIAVTTADYPAHPPIFRAAPKSIMKSIPESVADYDLFKAIWDKSELVPADIYPEWTATSTIADVARAVEAKLPERTAK